MPEPDRPTACDLSVVVPVFDGAALVERAAAQLTADLASTGLSFEVVFVDDGSADGTADAIRRAAARDPRIVAEILPANAGKGAAVASGMRRATGRVRAFTDVDVPYGTGPILELRRAILGGADVAVGDRRLAGSRYFDRVSLLRRVASHAFALVVRAFAPTDTLDTQCGVKAFDGAVAERLFPILRERGFAFDAEALYLVRKYRLRLARHPVSLVSTGPSSISVSRVALPMLVSVSKFPWRWLAGRYRDPWLAARGRKSDA